MDGIGLVFVAIFYLAILICGVWVARRKDVINGASTTKDDLMLAGRSLGLFVGIWTLVATEVGGVFVNGTSEVMYTQGALWALAPIGYSISMSINGLLFVHKLREKSYLTCIDALQSTYGKFAGGLVYLPSCIGDICWTAAVLSALGTTLAVILDMKDQVTPCVIASAIIAIGYTFAGGMYSVAYTDVLQLFFTFIGLYLSIPYMIKSDKTDIKSIPMSTWTGSIDRETWADWVDTLLLVLCGGIPWQPYYQRALAVKSTKHARYLSLTATFICLSCLIPPVLIGGLALSTDWTNSTFGQEMMKNSSEFNPSLVLPISMAELVPYWIGIIALAAVSAASMSSVDSSLLSGASYLTHNVCGEMLQLFDDGEKNCHSGAANPTKCGKFLSWFNNYVVVFRLLVLILGALSLGLCLAAGTDIYGLWVLAGDLGYVIVFPQFLMAVHWPQHVNREGSIAGAAVGIILRIVIGEPLIGLPSLVNVYQNEEESRHLIFPVKTTLMLSSLITLIFTSWIWIRIRQRKHGRNDQKYVMRFRETKQYS